MNVTSDYIVVTTLAKPLAKGYMESVSERIGKHWQEHPPYSDKTRPELESQELKISIPSTLVKLIAEKNGEAPCLTCKGNRAINSSHT